MFIQNFLKLSIRFIVISFLRKKQRLYGIA